MIARYAFLSNGNSWIRRPIRVAKSAGGLFDPRVEPQANRAPALCSPSSDASARPAPTPRALRNVVYGVHPLGSAGGRRSKAPLPLPVSTSTNTRTSSKPSARANRASASCSAKSAWLSVNLCAVGIFRVGRAVCALPAGRIPKSGDAFERPQAQDRTVSGLP
jgi:hypothetical protein